MKKANKILDLYDGSFDFLDLLKMSQVAFENLENRHAEWLAQTPSASGPEQKT